MMMKIFLLAVDDLTTSAPAMDETTSLFSEEEGKTSTENSSMAGI